MSIGSRQFAGFVILSFVLLALVPLLHAFANGGALDFEGAAARASAATGVEWTSNLYDVVRLASEESVLWLLVLGSSVPTLAALIAATCSGTPHLRRLLTRFRIFGPCTPWNEGVRAYAQVLLFVPACLIVAYALRALLPGAVYTRPEGNFGPTVVTALLSAAFLDQGGVLEELGWRGYAQAEFQRGRRSPLELAVLLGVIWGLWHVPRDVVGGVIERLGLFQYLVLFLPAFLLGTVTISIVAAYYMNRAGGSVLPAIMIHGLANDSMGLSGVATVEVALSPYHQVTKALPLLVFALVIVAISGRRLGLNDSTKD